MQVLPARQLRFNNNNKQSTYMSIVRHSMSFLDNMRTTSRRVSKVDTGLDASPLSAQVPQRFATSLLQQFVNRISLTSWNLISTCKRLMALLLPKLCHCCYCDCDAKSCEKVEDLLLHDRISIYTCLHYGQHDHTECSSPSVVDHICNTWILGTIQICLNIGQLFQSQVVCPRIRQSDFC